MDEITIHYRECTSEDIQCLQKLEAEVRKAAVIKGIAQDISWKAYAIKTELREYRLFTLSAHGFPEGFLGGDYGKPFLDRVSPQEFFDHLCAPKGND